MDIGWVLLLIAAAEVFLGIFFITRYQKTQATLWYGLFTISVAVYVASNSVGYLTDSYIISERIGWLGGILTATFILPFSWSFPVPRKTVLEILPYVLWPAVVFPPGIIFSNIFLSPESSVDYVKGYKTATGPYFWFMFLFFFTYWVWALTELITQASKSDGEHRSILVKVIIGAGLSWLVSVSVDVIYPLFRASNIGYIGSLFSVIWLSFTSYILLKK